MSQGKSVGKSVGKISKTSLHPFGQIGRIGWSGVLGLSLFGVPMLDLLISTPLVAIAQEIPTAIRQAYALLGQGLVDQAIASFRQAIQQYPQSAEARLGLGIAYRRAGRDADALRTYEQVLTIDPNNRLALLSIGVLGGYRAEWQSRGIEALNVLINLNANDTEARAQRALLYGYQGRFADAIADYTLVLQNNPTPATILGAAQIYAYSGNYPQSLSLFNRYQTTGGSITGGGAIAYALALRETGNPAQAVQILESQLRRSRSLDSTTIQTRAALAVAYAANQQFNQAASILTPLIGRQDSRLILARALNEVGRYSGDSTFIQQAADLYKQVLTSSPNLTVGTAREIADVLSSYPPEQTYALEVYRQLAQQNPGDRSLLVQQFVLERQLGVISNIELQQRLQATLQSLPSDPAQRQTIAQALARLDSPDPGLLPLYQTLLSAGVNQPFLNFRIAQIQIQLNDLAGARNSLAAYAATPAGTRDPFANLLLLAEIDRREGNLEASAQRYTSIITNNPSDSGVLSGALQGLAGIRQSQGRLPEAIALYDQIIARNPQDFAKQLGRASLAYQANLISQAQAEAVLNQWIATRPPTDTPPELVSLVAALPANPQREALYNALLAVDPANIQIQLRQVQAIATRSPDLAQAQIARLIARDPENLGAYFVQGQLAQEQGNLPLAGRAYETILSRNPNRPDALAALGGVRFQQRQYESAAQLYNQVLVMEPNNQGVQTALVGLTAAQGRRLDAIQQLEQMQLQQAATTGVMNEDLSRQTQQLQEGFLQQRGFQPSWERY
jgi:cellulose synthase operon protein C